MFSKITSGMSRIYTLRTGLMNIDRVPGTLLLTLALVLSLLTSTPATIINVPADQATVQAGIDAAGTGDTVLVAPGYYLENITIQDKEIVVSSHFLLDRDPAYISSTTIDGSNSSNPDTASAVMIFCSDTEAPVFQGFTVTGGEGTLMQGPNEGLVNRFGGGIATRSGAPIIRFNYIHHNEPSAPEGCRGGGIYMQLGDPVLENNIIVHNPARSGCGLCIHSADVTVNNNIIAYNSGGEAFGGGGIYIYVGQITGSNNTIAFNSSIQHGGGIRVAGANVNLSNSILWANLSPSVPAQTYIAPAYGGTITLEYSDVQGGYAGTGNISTNPMFTGDWLLLEEESFCIDVGDTGAAFNDNPWPSTPSEARWPSHGGLRNDMGAYGGPGCYPFELAPFHADSNVGWVPMEVNFEAGSSYFEVESWSWNFGDGDSEAGQTVAHTYEEPGLYDVTLTVGYDAGETYEYTREALVYALADTMWVESIGCDTSTATVPVEILVHACNSVPLDTILIPIACSGDLQLVYQGFTTDGCRTVDFDTAIELSHDSAAGTALIELSGGSGLAPGSGPILKLLFDIVSAGSGQSATIALTSGLISDDPEFSSGTVVYQPATIDGVVQVNQVSCCAGSVGDVDQSGGVDITDISILVDNQFLTLTPLVCQDEGNINYPGSGYSETDMVVDITDLSILIDNQFLTLTPLPPCP